MPGRAVKTAVLCACLFLLRASCGGDTVKTTTQHGSADELSRKDAQLFVQDTGTRYPAYKSLNVNFTLKGRVNNEELYYEGELASAGDELKIRLKDAVFLSPLISLEIGKDKVRLKDHARNKSETLPRSEYQWVDLFGRSFPLRFFEPLMRGFLPADATDRESTFARTTAGEVLVRSNNTSYDAAMYFEQATLKRIFYRDKQRGEILVFYLGEPFKKRTYPQTLKIEHSRTNDQITLSFRALRVAAK